MLKGVAILMMLCHHVIFHGKNGGYYPNMPLQVYEWGCNFKTCVCLFAFVTGYGLCCKSFSVQKIVSSTIRQWMSFWPTFLLYVFSVCCLYLIIDGGVPFSKSELWGQVFCLSDRIENFWYATAFMLQVLVFYPLLCLSRRTGHTCRGVLALTLAVLCFLWLKKYIMFGLFQLGMNEDFYFSYLNAICNSLKYSMFFLIGWISRDWVSATGVCEKLIFAVNVLIIVIATSFFGIRIHFIPFVLPIAFIYAKKWHPAWLCSFLTLMGYYSFHMWLNHAFIYSYWLKDTFFKIPPGINYVVLCGASLLLAIVTVKLGMMLREKVIMPLRQLINQ